MFPNHFYTIFKQRLSASGATDAHLNDIKADIWSHGLMMRNTSEQLSRFWQALGQKNNSKHVLRFPLSVGRRRLLWRARKCLRVCKCVCACVCVCVCVCVCGVCLCVISAYFPALWLTTTAVYINGEWQHVDLFPLTIASTVLFVFVQMHQISPQKSWIYLRQQLWSMGEFRHSVVPVLQLSNISKNQIFSMRLKSGNCPVRLLQFAPFLCHSFQPFQISNLFKKLQQDHSQTST